MQPNAEGWKDMADIQMMVTLDHKDIPPFDWIIVADMNELCTFPKATLSEVTANMEANGANYALGVVLDHISRPESSGSPQVA